MDCRSPGSSVHGISQQEYWEGLPFPSPGDLPRPGIKPEAPALAGRVFYHGATWEAQPTNEQIPHHERDSNKHESVFATAARALQRQLLEVVVFLPEEPHFCVWNLYVIGARLCPSPPHSSSSQCSHGLSVLCMPEIRKPVPGDSS